MDAMYAYLDDFTEFSDRLKAKTMGGPAREEAEDAVSAIRRRHFRVVQRLAEVRHASGDRWSERKESVAAARAELERKAEAALKTFD